LQEGKDYHTINN